MASYTETFLFGIVMFHVLAFVAWIIYVTREVQVSNQEKESRKKIE